MVVLAQTPVLLRTFNNPTPNVDDNFGSAMAALGNDRVLIGARYDDTTATNAGAVYFFHTNGTLLATITNPIPTVIFPYADEQFGSAIATLGSDRIVIGSPMVGKVFLFTTNGTWLTTLNKLQFLRRVFWKCRNGSRKRPRAHRREELTRIMKSTPKPARPTFTALMASR